LTEGTGGKLTESLRRVALGFGPPRAEGARIVLVTSAVAADGKGSVAAGLASVLARESRRVLLVDIDADSPSIAGMVRRSNEIEETFGTLDREAALSEMAVPIWRNVDLLSDGCTQDANSMPKQELVSLVRRVRTSVYQYAILNVPPLLRSANASWLASA